MSYKYCIVPLCFNNNRNKPNKMFISVPREEGQRKAWLRAVNRPNDFTPKSHVFCCEDHFDIENDAENFSKYKMVGGLLKMKKNVVPHKFVHPIQKPSPKIITSNKTQSQDELTETLDIQEIYIVKEDPVDPLDCDINYQIPSHSKTIKKCNKKIQACLKYKVLHKATITEKKYLKENKSLKPRFEVVSITSASISSEDFDMSNTDSSNDEDNSELEDKDRIDNMDFKVHMAKAALLCISRAPILLIGIPKQCYFLINLLGESVNFSHRDIMITLKKIRLYQSNALLALDFGLTTSMITLIFKRTVAAVASCMKRVVYFPDSHDVLVHLPMPFRKQYNNIQSIIDCLEIQVQKPSNAVQQALTWSEYKNANTMKYLVSITPDGLINFISEGYGGRTSDAFIFEDCGLVEKLPENTALLADRGFKNIAHLVVQKGCTLIKPPTVKKNIIPTKNEVLETKKIAALRIHVERSIRRLRDFGFLKPHACVNYKQIHLLDDCITIACGIVNLQNPLFKCIY